MIMWNGAIVMARANWQSGSNKTLSRQGFVRVVPQERIGHFYDPPINASPGIFIWLWLEIGITNPSN